jgi:homoaconitase/3-isopropylmalate dehydratase large subunit
MPGFTLQTVPNGHNSGRLFIFTTDSHAQCVEAMGKIAAALEAADVARVLLFSLLLALYMRLARP